MSTTTIRTGRRRTITALATLAVLPMTAAGAGAAAPTPHLAGATTQDDDAQLMLLVDGSRSMEDPDATGAPKIDAARTALDAVIDGLDPDQSVGLRVFGGTVPVDQPMADKCSDSELVVPIGTDNATDLTQAVQDYTPTGETPIGLALQDAAKDLGTDGNRTILLVSDGIATCDPDPCEVAEELVQDGFDLQVHTVGLGVDDEARSQLRCIAEAAGGTYYDAEDTDTLTTALTRISTRAFRPFNIQGEPVEGTADPADAPVLTPGQYVDEVAVQQGRYYIVERSHPGASLHIGATMRPDAPTGTSVFDLRLQTLDGSNCDMGVVPVWSAGASSTFGSGDVTGYSTLNRAEDPCGTDEQLLLSIAEQPGSNLGGHPVEIWVHEEPAWADLTGLPDSQANAVWQGVEPGAPVGQVVGGTSFSDATRLEAGNTYTSDIVPGEVLVFSVPVDWGQHLETLLEFPQPSESLAEQLGPIGTAAEVHLFGPDRGEAASILSDTGGISRKAIVSTTERTLVGSLTYDVEWNNRRWTTNRANDRPGDYFVVVSAVSDSNKSVPIPFTITTEVVGEVSGAPTYDTADGAGTESAPTTGPDSAEATSAPTRTDPEESEDAAATTEPTDSDVTADVDDQDGDTDDGVSPLVWVLGGLGVALAAVGGVVLTTRGRS